MGTTLRSVYHNTVKFRHLIALLLTCAAGAFAEGLPDLGEVAQSALTPLQERRLGESIMREIRADRSFFDDAEATDYINSLGYRLASVSPDARQSFEFFLIQDGQINAFALPGGFVGVNTGLILTAQNESELASVIAHEIAHVTQRHIARMVAQQQQSQLTTLAGLALAILASRYDSQLGQAAFAATQAGAIQSQLNFTRDNEREADRVGLQILQQAGFDVRAMPVFFERMQRAYRVYETSAPAYLRTHPLEYQRIADMQDRVQAMPYRQVLDSLEFQLIRAKLRATVGNPREAVGFFEESLTERKYASEAASRYGLAASLTRTKDYARAERELAALRKLVTASPIVETLAAQLKIAAGQTAAALAHYREALKRYPNYRALVYDYASALLENRQPEQALKLVEERLQFATGDHRLYLLQARSYAALDKRLLQHKAQAEAYVRMGNVSAAVEQLQIALKSGDGDFYQLSSVEARLRELRRLDEEQRKESGKR